MRSQTPHLETTIDLEQDLFATKVIPTSVVKEGKYIYYKYPVSIFEVSNPKEGYELSAVAQDFENYFESIENAKFKYILEKRKGEFDFTQLEWMQPVTVTFHYRVDDNVKYFTEYAGCTLKDIFKKKGDESKGECTIKRDIVKWEIEII